MGLAGGLSTRERESGPIGRHDGARILAAVSDDRPGLGRRSGARKDVAVHRIDETAVGSEAERRRQLAGLPADRDEPRRYECEDEKGEQPDGSPWDLTHPCGPRRDRGHGDPPFGDAPGGSAPRASGPREDLPEQLRGDLERRAGEEPPREARHLSGPSAGTGGASRWATC